MTDRSRFSIVPIGSQHTGWALKVDGKAGRMPPEPLEPPPPATARRLDRETWRKIAHGEARVLFLLNGKFDELRAAYAMSDEDLWRFLSQREQAV